MQPSKGFLIWLAGLSVLGFLATDMYLPAFAAIQQDLNTEASAVSASLSLFLAGFAFAPLLWLSPALAPLLGSWILNHFDWQAIFATLFVVTLILMVPTLRLRPRTQHYPQTDDNRVSFLSLLRSPVYGGNVLVYAACSASFFAWLTGSPFILNDMGYSPAAIGLSYMPQTIAFLIGGYGCRSALQKWQGKQMLPWLLALYTLSVFGTWAVAVSGHANLTLLLIPFCVMAMANGAIYPLVVAAALLPFPQATGKAAALQNTLQLGLCFFASLVVSWLVATPLLTTTSFMLATVAMAILGYLLQRRSRARNWQTAQASSSRIR